MGTVFVLYRQVSQYESVECLGYVEKESEAEKWISDEKVKHSDWSHYYKPVYKFHR